MINIYLASSFRLVDKVILTSLKLEEAGYIITCKWWERIYLINGLPVLTTELKRRYEGIPSEKFFELLETKLSCEADLQGIEDADFFVLVGGNHLEERFTGANIELGYALRCGKKCFSVGKIRNCVFYSLITRCKTVEELMRYLK